MPTDEAITLQLGQAVYWPSSPVGFAQVSEFRRKKVQLCYRRKNGTFARPVVAVVELAAILRGAPLLFRLHNPFDRGVRPRAKTFQLPTPPPPESHLLKKAA